MSFKRLMLIISVVVGTVFAGNATARDALGGEAGKGTVEERRILYKVTRSYDDTRANEPPQGDDKVRKEEIAVSMPKKSGGIGGGPKELNSFLK